MTCNKIDKQDLELTARAPGNPIFDLKAAYGNTYRVKRDENGHYIIPHKWKNDLDMGFFYVYSATKLACFMTGNRKFNMIRDQFPGIEVTQRGDQEIVFTFTPDLLPGLAKALKAARKKRYSPETLERMRQRGRELAKFRVERGLTQQIFGIGHLSIALSG